MMRQPEPAVVMPPPSTVPREMVTYSRTVVSAPMVQRVGSPAYFRSCGATPRQANGWTVAPGPRVKWPSRTTCEMRRQFSPRTTLAAMVHHGPTVQDAGMCAPAATMAVGWMLAALLTRLQLRRELVRVRARQEVRELVRA